MNGRVIWLVLGVAMLGLLVPDSSIAEVKISGDHGTFVVRMQYIGFTRVGTQKLSDVSAKVVGAFRAAQSNDYVECQKQLGVAASSSATTLVSQVFNQWRRSPQGIAFVLGPEATATPLSPTGRTAIAVVTVSGAFQHLVSSRVLLFEAQQGRLALISNQTDQRLVQELQTLAEKPFLRTSAGPEQVQRMEEQVKEELLQQMAATHKRDQVVRLMEEFDQRTKGVEIRNWNSWTNYYATVLLDPPVVFDARTNDTYSYSTPLQALESYMHAIQVGNGKELLRQADATGNEFLRTILGVREEQSGQPYDRLFPKLTRITVLMTARTIVRGTEYVMFVIRKEAPRDVADDRLVLGCRVFRKVEDRYLYSQDMRGSPLTAVFRYAGVTDPPVGPAAKVLQRCKNSQLPPHFYTLP
jgi:hypothetical protein